MTDEDDDGRIGAYAPPADDMDMFDARGEESRRGPLLLTLAVTVVIAFFGIVYIAYQSGLRERDEAPRIRADAEPYRVVPPDPGGEATPNTDIAVYDRLSGESEEGEATPRDAPEEPVPGLRVETVGADETTSEPAAEEDRLSRRERRLAARNGGLTEEPAPSTTPTPAPAPVEAEPEPAPVPAETRPAPPPAAVAASSIASDGEWVIQIASLPSQEGAEAAWIAFSSANADIVSGLAPDIATVEIEGRGTFHRLRVAAFTARDAAVSFCEQLQTRGQDCLVRRR
jgi:cell division protein FtsN